MDRWMDGQTDGQSTKIQREILVHGESSWLLPIAPTFQKMMKSASNIVFCSLRPVSLFLSRRRALVCISLQNRLRIGGLH